MRSQRRIAVVTASVASVALLLTGCAAGEPTESAKDYSVLELGLSSDLASLVPGRQASFSDGVWQTQAVYDTLLRCDETGAPSGNAAETFSMNGDNTELTLELRDGMTFSDGSPVDSAAVKASIERFATAGSADAYWAQDITVTTPDELTAVLTTPEPNGLLPNYMCLAAGTISSPDAIPASDDDVKPLVSSGPYTYNAAESTSGSVYTFDKREDYWNADEFPYEQIVMTVIMDPTARLNALKTGQVDAARIVPGGRAEAEASGLTVYDLYADWAGLNIADRDGTVVPALADVRVRQAINMVFDREAIVQGIFQGNAVPATQPFGESSDAFDESIEGYEFDVEGAQELMAEAGYEDGFEVEIPSLPGTGVTDASNPFIIQQLAELNITATEVPLSGPTTMQELFGGRFPIMYVTIGSLSGLKDVDGLLTQGSSWNIFDSATPELDTLIGEAMAAQGDDQTTALREINNYVVDEAWFAPWAFPANYFATVDEDTVVGSSDYGKTVATLWDFQ